MIFGHCPYDRSRASAVTSRASSTVGRRPVAVAERANEAVVREIFDAFARKEGFALRGHFAEDAVWSVPGRGVMAGTYRGRDEIIHRDDLVLTETRG